MVKYYYAYWEVNPPKLTKNKIYDILDRNREEGYFKILDDNDEELEIRYDTRLCECFLEIC